MTRTGENKRTDLLRPGDGLEPLEFHVTREFNENYLHAVADLHPRYQEATGAGPALVHTGLLVNFSNLTRSPSFHLPDGVSAIYTHEEVEFVGLGRVGETFRVRLWRHSSPALEEPFSAGPAPTPSSAGPTRESEPLEETPDRTPGLHCIDRLATPD